MSQTPFEIPPSGRTAFPGRGGCSERPSIRALPALDSSISQDDGPNTFGLAPIPYVPSRADWESTSEFREDRILFSCRSTPNDMATLLTKFQECVFLSTNFGFSKACTSARDFLGSRLQTRRRSVSGEPRFRNPFPATAPFAKARSIRPKWTDRVWHLMPIRLIYEKINAIYQSPSPLPEIMHAFLRVAH